MLCFEVPQQVVSKSHVVFLGVLLQGEVNGAAVARLWIRG